MADGQDELEAVEVDEKLSESQKFALYKDLEGYRILWDSSCVLSKKKQQNKSFQGLSSSSLRPKQIAASALFLQRKNWAAAIFVYHNLQHFILLQDKLVTHVVMHTTTDFNLQCNNVATQVKRKCCRITGPLKLSSC